MGTGQKDIADLGPIGIVRESLKVFFTHAKFFLLIQLTLVLPVTIFSQVMQYVLVYIQKSKILPPPPSAHVSHLAASSYHSKLVSFHTQSNDPFHYLILFGLLVFIVGAATQLARGLWISATFYSVGLIYAGKRVVFLDVLRAVIPRLYGRLTVTSLYYILLLYSIELTQTVVMIVITRFLIGNMGMAMLGMGLVLVVFFIPQMYIAIIFSLASGVSVLEVDYGWPAFKKAVKLLQGKRWVAVGFQVLLFVPGAITFALILSKPQASSGDLSSNPIALVLRTVVSVAWPTFAGQLICLCSAVQYASFKAYHNESIADSSILHYEGDTNDGYVAV